MLTTKIFRNGNSQAVRRVGKALAALARFSPDFMADGRGTQDQKARDPL